MILSIKSSIPTFKSVQFKEGLNVLLADIQPHSTERQTRNSAGKTSLIEIVHFLMGSNCDKSSLFRNMAIIDHTFNGLFIIGGQYFEIERAGADPSKIYILNYSSRMADIKPKIDKLDGRAYVTNMSWRSFLGHSMFGIPADAQENGFNEPHAPSFRSLFSYFVRRRNAGGFNSPERHTEAQQRVDWQVNLSYLLGLDWQISLEFQKIRARERTLVELKKANQEGVLGQMVGTVAELRPQVTIAETKANRLREQLNNFEVLESYRDLSQRAARAKTEMQALGREAVRLNEVFRHLVVALSAEAPPSIADIEKLYYESGVELPSVALRRLEEVKQFYESVIQNRRMHLEHDVVQAQRQIEENESKIQKLDFERRDILKTLEGRGAFEDLINLQRELAELEASAAALRERYKSAELLEGQSTQLVIDRANLKRRLQEDHQQRRE